MPLRLCAGESQGTNLTVYNNDLVLVGDEGSPLEVLAESTHPLSFFEDIASTIDPTEQ